MPSLEDLIYSVGGGQDQSQSALQAFLAAQAAELARQQMGQGLLSFLQETQRSPFSIVPALQAYGGVGGGTLAPAGAFAATGGQGTPSPYGAIAQQLIEGLAEFTGGAPYNPGTGRPFTADELAFLRKGMFSSNPQDWFANAQRSFNQGDLTQEQKDYLAPFPTSGVYSPGMGVNPQTGFQGVPQGVPERAPAQEVRIAGQQPARSAQRYLRTTFGL